MKTHMLVFCSLLILLSCNQHEPKNKFAQEEIIEIIKNDPVFLEYHKNKEAIAKLVNESESFDSEEYFEIVKTKKTADYCNVDKRIFNGDVEMEQLAVLFCKIKITRKDFHDKYPDFKNLSRDEKTQFFIDVNMPFNYDKKAIKKKGEKKYYEEQEQK